MKLIEGLKAQKVIMRKIEDLQKKIQNHAAYSSLERPVYKDESEPDSPKAQIAQIDKWISSIRDLTKLMAITRLQVQFTNIVTTVTIDINGTKITKTIAEWIHWRREFSDIMYRTHQCLGDKGIREGIVNDSQGTKHEVKIVRCYSPAQRDKNMADYRDMKFAIDSTLEIVNATTDMVEASEINILIAARNADVTPKETEDK